MVGGEGLKLRRVFTSWMTRLRRWRARQRWKTTLQASRGGAGNSAHGPREWKGYCRQAVVRAGRQANWQTGRQAASLPSAGYRYLPRH